MANYIYGAVSLTGGGTGSLDSLNGADLAQADAAIVFTPTATYIYTLDEANGGTENVPELIVPDQSPESKRWVLVSSRAAESSCDYTLFNGILSASDDDVQKALSTIDDMFDTGDFVIAPGSVKLSPAVVKSIGTGVGSVTPVNNVFNILGSGKVKTVGSGSNVTVSIDDLKIATKTSSYSVLPTDDIIVADCAGGNVELTLPQASTKSAVTVIKKSNSNTLTIGCYGSETIEGRSTVTILDEYGTLRLISDGTNTWITSAQMYDLPVANEYEYGAVKVGANLKMDSGAITTDFSAFNADIIPDVDVTRSLGSETKAWKDVFIGPGSLYVNGQKVIEEAAGTIVLSADIDQNVQIRTGGGGDIEFYPAGSGAIEMKGNLSIQGGKNFISNDGNPIKCTVGFDMDERRIRNVGAPVNPSDVATKAFASNASNLTSGTLPSGLLPANYLTVNNNLSDLANITTAKTNLGLNNVPNVNCTNASNITTGTLPSSVLPPIAITTTQVAANLAAMLALTTQQGDVVVRTDESKSYIHNGGSVGTMADFTELSTPVDSVLSVNTKTGTISLNQDDIPNGVSYVRTANNFTTTLLTKLNSIETGAEVNLTASEIKTAYESNENTNAFTDERLSKLNGIEDNATGDQTALEIKTAYESNVNTNAFTDAFQTKLNGINTSLYLAKASNLGDITNTSAARTNLGLGNVANVDTTNASNITTGTLPSSVLPPIAITKTQLASSEVAMLALTSQEGDVVIRTDLNRSYIHNAGTAGTMADFNELLTPTDTILSVNSKTGTVVLSQDDVGDGSTYVRTHNDFTDAYESKLDGIETSATADQTAGEIKTAYESNSDTNAFTDALQTKLNGINTSLYLQKTDNLAALSNKTTARTNLGLGNVANVDTTNASNITTGTLPSSVLPPIAITSTQVAANQASMLALVTQEGDVVVRTDENKSYIKGSGTAGTMADFIELASIGQAVSSVNSKTGTVVLTQDDINNGSTYVRTTNDYTDIEVTKLQGIEDGATADQTAAEILTLIKTVDGTGSGLDADLIDGKNANAGAIANTIVLRDASANITTASFLGTNVSVSHASEYRTTDTIFYSSTDNYVKKNDALGLKTSLGLENVSNITAATGSTGNTLVQRDANGDFSAVNITAELIGNSSTATKLATAKALTLSGDVSGTVDFDGSANVSITTTVANNSHDHLWANISDKPTEFEPVVASVKAMVGQMVTGNTETGLSVTYQSTDNTLDFVLTADPVITLSGDVTGTGTMTNLTSTTITTTVVDDSHNHTLSTLPSVDEDDMVSDSAILLPSQQSVKAYVDNKVSGILSSAPAALDTLNELAAALGDDPNFATTTATALGEKALKTTTITAGAGLTGGGTLSADRTISHADTSTQASVANSDRTYIQSITLDDYGHITAVTSATETAESTDTWRDIDDVPTDGADTISISSNWAYDHNASTSAHGAVAEALAFTIARRDSSGSCFFNQVGLTSFAINHAQTERLTDTVFYSGTDDSVFKNTLTGFKTSLALENVSNVAAASTNTANTIVLRDASGNFSAGIITATATTARFADLAERYTCEDTTLPTGTIVSACLEGTFEVQECNDTAGHNVIGVVSEAAAYIMNSELENSIIVGLTGKVPVRIIGPVQKGKVIMSAGNGCAKQITHNVEILFKIGVALESNEAEGEKLVMCAIK